MFSMKKYLLLFVLVAVGISSANAQTMKAYLKAADEAFDNKDFYSALAYYENALQFESDNMEVLYKSAESARHFNSYTVAERNYQQVVDNESNAGYPLASYWLANMKQKLGKYNEAKEAYELYLSENDANSYYAEKARKEVAACEWAQSQMNTEYDEVKVNRYGTEINTEYSEFGAIEVGDELYYSSLRFDKSPINGVGVNQYSSLLVSKDGSEGELVDDNINDGSEHVAHMAFNASETRAYYTKCRYINASDIDCEIYYRDGSVASWGDEVKLPESINMTGYTSTQPNIGMDANGNEVLYFVSNRVGGKGNLDIWSSVITGTGFSTPTNLSSLNTSENDITPFYDAVNEMLYFSSEGYQGLGGYDIYSSEVAGGTYGVSTHMGAPLNSSFDDVYFTRNGDGETGNFSSNRSESLYLDEGTEACCYDVYSAKFEPIVINLQALTYDKVTRADLLGATVRLICLDDPEVDPIVVAHDDFNYSDYSLMKNKNYMIIADKPGYTSDTIKFSTANIRKPEDITKRLYLKPLTLGLDVLTYDAKYLKDLNGTTVKLVDLSDNSVDAIIRVDANGNFYNYTIECDKEYMIVASKKGYEVASTTFDTYSDCDGGTVTKKLYLGLGALETYLPISLYFDNDEPDRRTLATTTDKSYLQTYPPYYSKKQEFKDQYSKRKSGEARTNAQYDVDGFFEAELRKGKEDLEKFLDEMIEILSRGDRLEIFVKGYTSPRATSEYNLALGQRRIESVKNEFLRYKNGIVRQWLNSGTLKITQRSFGEATAPTGISDVLNDRINSIYSPSASRERRVEIVQVNRR